MRAAIFIGIFLVLHGCSLAPTQRHDIQRHDGVRRTPRSYNYPIQRIELAQFSGLYKEIATITISMQIGRDEPRIEPISEAERYTSQFGGDAYQIVLTDTGSDLKPSYAPGSYFYTIRFEIKVVGWGTNPLNIIEQPDKQSLIKHYYQKIALDPVEGLWISGEGKQEVAIFKTSPDNYVGFLIKNSKMSEEIKMKFKKTGVKEMLPVVYLAPDGETYTTTALISTDGVLTIKYVSLKSHNLLMEDLWIRNYPEKLAVVSSPEKARLNKSLRSCAILSIHTTMIHAKGMYSRATVEWINQVMNAMNTAFGDPERLQCQKLNPDDLTEAVEFLLGQLEQRQKELCKQEIQGCRIDTEYNQILNETREYLENQ